MRGLLRRRRKFEEAKVQKTRSEEAKVEESRGEEVQPEMVALALPAQGRTWLQAGAPEEDTPQKGEEATPSKLQATPVKLQVLRGRLSRGTFGPGAGDT